MNNLTVAIHQPNFFPWLGYFDKIVRADVFVLLDDVQFPKTGGSWLNRVKFLISGTPNWVTAGIDRNYSGTRNINEMHFQASNPWREKSFRSIENSYKKHPFYQENIQLFSDILMNPESNIAAYNINAIFSLSNYLGIDTDKFLQSSKVDFKTASNELLCDLTSYAGGTVYMCGGGADGYQDEAVFTERGIQLLYQSFKHPVYPQKGQEEFVPGLSIIDALMNIGAKGVAELLQPKI